MRFVFFAKLDPFAVDIVDDELGKEKSTSLSGFLRARTEEVGMPTKPAPKHAILYELMAKFEA